MFSQSLRVCFLLFCVVGRSYIFSRRSTSWTLAQQAHLEFNYELQKGRARRPALDDDPGNSCHLHFDCCRHHIISAFTPSNSVSECLCGVALPPRMFCKWRWCWRACVGAGNGCCPSFFGAPFILARRGVTIKFGRCVCGQALQHGCSDRSRKRKNISNRNVDTHRRIVQQFFPEFASPIRLLQLSLRHVGEAFVWALMLLMSPVGSA